jgi:transposase
MLTLPPGVRVFVATARVDGRKGIDGLSVLVRSQFAEDPLSGSMYVFFSRRADRVRVLYWDRDGYVLVTKRLEKGTFRIPWPAEQERAVIEAAELLLVLEGIDLRGAGRRARWSPRSRVRAPTTV